MRTYVFIDASNLFYGGRKSLGWDIDHEKLLAYLKNRYQATEIYYFGGAEIYNFPFNYIECNTVPLKKVCDYLVNYLQENSSRLNDLDTLLINKYLKKVRFYMKIESFGYKLILKPIKTYIGDNGVEQRKANCDVDMTFLIMKYRDDFDRVTVVSGDGDFLPVLKYLKDIGKEVLVLSNSLRTAKEIKLFAGDKFLDFEFLREIIKVDDKNLEK
ncbi:MAG: NYN domain-containing protein [bacterium]